MHPFMIVFEGIDGSGKSSQVALAAAAIAAPNCAVGTMKFPNYGSETGARVQEYLFSGDARQRPLDFQALQFMDKLNGAHDILHSKDDVLVLDRFMGSSIAFAAAAGLDHEMVARTNAVAFRGLLYPDVTVYLDITADQAAERLGDCKDSHEADVEFQERARTHYKHLAATLHGWHTIDASGTLEATHELVMPLLLEQLRQR